jgi:hypothetical protein
MLPDIALLEIFDLYNYDADSLEEWYTLVHVCRNWRIIVWGHHVAYVCDLIAHPANK